MSDAAHSAAAPYDFGARGAVGLVAEVGGLTGAGLDRHPETELDQLFDDFGNRRNPLFAREGFPWHPDALHRCGCACLHENLLEFYKLSRREDSTDRPHAISLPEKFMPPRHKRYNYFPTDS